MTTTPKLTPAQVRVLRELCAGHDTILSDYSWKQRGRTVTAQMRVITRVGGLVAGYYFGSSFQAKATPAAHALIAELDKAYFAIAQRRIEQAAAQPLLLAPVRETAEQISFGE